MNYIESEIKRALNKTINRKIEKELNQKLALPIGIGAAAVVIATAVLSESEAERNSLEYARYDIDGHGKAADNVRLCFLSDLHEKKFGENNCELLDFIDKADPDVVLIGGDMAIAGNRNPERNRTAVTLSLCRELAGRYPVFYGNGNHEQRLTNGDFRESLEKTGVVYLSNETADWKYNISITGLNLSTDQYKPLFPDEPDKAFIESRIGHLNPDRYNILLAHSPLFIKNYAVTGADLVLSGHFHGGTIQLPGEVGLMTPQYQFFNTNVVGKRHCKDTDMVISGGLGTHSVNLRLNNKPQVVVVDIKK